VRESLSDPELNDWLRRLLFEEIAPTLEGRCDAPETFAHQVLERFANPFLEHKLSSILLYHEQKKQVRLAPTRAEYEARFGRVPALLEESLTFPAPA
jgi:tagaturonate reductase